LLIHDSNENCIHKEIKSRFKFRECLLPFTSEYFLPSHLIYKNLKIKIYKIRIVPVVLCGLQLGLLCKGRFLFENKVLKRMFGPKTTEVEGGWKRLHIEEFYNMGASPNAIRVIKSRRMR
jgi:hypothetical protein